MLSERRFNGGFALFSNNEPLLDSRIGTSPPVPAEPCRRVPLPVHQRHSAQRRAFSEAMPSLHHLTINSYDNDGRLLPSVREVYDYAKTHMESANVDIFVRRKDELLTTRAGTAPNRRPITPLEVSCFLPFSQLIIRPDGKISQCCEDALGRATLGDLSCQTLSEAWSGTERLALQERMRVGRRVDDSICRDCDTLDLSEQE